MTRFLAAVHLDRREQVFVIHSPDFPDVLRRCRRFADVRHTAMEVIQEKLRQLETEGSKPPHPTPKESLQERGEYRSCFLIPVEWDDPARRNQRRGVQA